jgi:hypothetical protein
MKGKAALVVGLGAGYVLGTRDGRGRYQQIKSQANRLLQDPRVQQKASQASDLAREKAPVVKDKVSGVTQKATSKVAKRSGRGSDGSWSDSVTATGPTTTGPTTTGPTTTGPTTTGPTTTGSATDSSEDQDAIILTAPSPSPLAPGPTKTSSDSNSGGLHG